MTDTQMEAAPLAAPAMASVFSSRSFHRLQLRHFLLFDVLPAIGTIASRSEERRVGKECRP